MEEYFRKRVLTVGVTIILVEIVVLAMVGSFYIWSISNAIDERVESRVQIPGQLMNAGLLNFDAVQSNSQMSELVGDEYIDGMVIGVDYNVYYSLNPEYLGQNAEDIPTLDTSLLDVQNPSEVHLHVNGSLVSVSIIYGVDGVTPRFFVYVVVGTSAATAEKTQTTYLFILGSGAVVVLTLIIVTLSINLIRKLEHSIIERERAEDELRELTEELEQRVKKRTQQLVASNQDLESFAYSVSHDLRAPLRGIDGFSMAVLEDYSEVLDERGRDYLRRMHDAAVRMSELIDDILSLSRVSRGEMHFEEIDMTDLARTITGELQSQEPKRKVKLVISNNLVAYGDEQLMYLILDNLLRNAWKFTSKRKSARIEFGSTEQENETVFFVRDNGVGFDMKYVDKLFNVFQRLHRADEYEGTGIGLAIVKRIISRHEGRTWAEGNVGKGATFYFTLPSEGSELLK